MVEPFTRVPRLAAHWAKAGDGEPSRLYLLSEDRRYLLQDSAGALRILKWVDGERSVEELQALLGAQMAPEQVAHTVSQLERLGVLTFAKVDGSEERRALFDALEWSDEPCPEACVVSCRSAGELDVELELTQALEDCGFRLTRQAALSLLICSDAAGVETAERVAALTADGRRCLLVQPFGVKPSFGPLLGSGVPGAGLRASSLEADGACYECLRYALRQQRSVESYLQARGQRVRVPPAATRSSLRSVCGIVAHHARGLFREVQRTGEALSRGASGAWEVVVFDLGEAHVERHRLRRRPQCARCGEPALQRELAAAPIHLREVPISHWQDGGYRAEAPELRLQRLKPLVSALLGPVAYLRPAPGGDARWPVFFSGFSVCPQRKAESAADFTRVCAGKGVSRVQARTSALAEAVERLSCVYRGDEPSFSAEVRELGSAAVPPFALESFSEKQHQQAPTGGPRALRVPRVTTEASRVCWTNAWSLTDHCRRFVPLAYCFAETPDVPENAYSVFTSNGSAAGGCLEEALLQGLLELVERDAVSIWWYNQVRRPPARVPIAVAKQFEEQRLELARLSFDLALFDLTHDIGIPVTAAVAHAAASGELAMGFGCHLEEMLATQRALTELSQVLDTRGGLRTPWTNIAVRDFFRPSLNSAAADRLGPAGERAFRHSDSAAGAPEAGATAIPGAPRHANLRAALLEATERLANCGLEVIAVNKTRPELELSVVQVIIPGLRHIWPRYGPGRLYQVPVRLGWIPQPLSEEELNPEPLLL